MSDVTLHAVLVMPPEAWLDTAMDKSQRYECYLRAALKIKQCEQEIERLRDLILQSRVYVMLHSPSGEPFDYPRELVQKIDEALQKRGT